MMFVASTDKMDVVSAIAIGLAIATFSLSYLGGFIIKKHKGAIRLGVLISVLWIFGVGIASVDERQFAEIFIFLGLSPVVFYFSILWVISGFLPNKNNMPG